jgi:hypothetical protein
LLKDDNVRKQAARMLKDARGQAFVRNFSGQWLQIRALNEIEIDEKKYPKFNWQLREAMKEESRLFFDAVVREDRSIYDLVEADFTYVNQRLAELYGLPGVQGDKFQRVQLPADSPRGGVLGQAAVLMATSMPTRTSPVIRGKWVLEQLLGTPPPPPPANVPPLEATKVDKNAPLRVRLEQHRQNPDCAVCHEKIDPVGFALENFDAIGAWRTQDGTAPIDASGILPNGKKVNGVAELKQYVKGEKFARSFAQKMMVYALGRGLQRGDKAAVDAVVKADECGRQQDVGADWRHRDERAVLEAATRGGGAVGKRPTSNAEHPTPNVASECSGAASEGVSAGFVFGDPLRSLGEARGFLDG